MNHTPAEVAAVLRAAADLIEPPGRWTQRFSARDVKGSPAGPTSPEAVCWCAYGALMKVSIDLRVNDVCAAQSACHRALSLFPRPGVPVSYATFSSVPEFNDARGRTQAEVLQLLRKAAELAEGETQ